MDQHKERKCPRCAGPVTGNPNRIYCCLECQWRFGYEKVQAQRNRSYPTEPCPFCGAPVVRKAGRKFCNRKHQVAFNAAKLTKEDRRRYQEQHKANMKTKAARVLLVKRRSLDHEIEEHKPAQPRRASLAEAQEQVEREVYG